MPQKRVSPFTGSQLKDLRNEAGYTQEELAAELGFGKDKLRGIEKGDPKFLKNFTFDQSLMWWQLCRKKASEKTRKGFMKSITDFYKIVTQ